MKFVLAVCSNNGYGRSMTKTMTLVLLFAVGCAGSFGGPASTTHHHTLYNPADYDTVNKVVHVTNRVLFVASELAIACDWHQTYHFAAAGWPDGRDATGVYQQRESNPIMGGQPSTTTLNLYMGAVMVANAVAAKYLPEWAQTLAFAAELSIENDAIHTNWDRVRCW